MKAMFLINTQPFAVCVCSQHSSEGEKLLLKNCRAVPSAVSAREGVSALRMDS